MAGVTLQRLSKTFPGGARAIRELSLEIEDGELMVFLGPSGCGKSTLLRLVAGLETATAGRVLIGGEDVAERSPQERNVAMVFQSYALYPHKTVRANLEFPLRMRGRPADEIDERVRDAAGLLGLEELLDRRPGELSGGQAQRAAMGRAIVRDPSAFLLDEPLSNLDAKLRTAIRGEIARLQERLGTTTLYVTHDQVEAMTLGHRVAVLRDGELHQVAVPRELYERPVNLFVAGFIGSPPMNLMAAEPVGGGRVRAGDLELEAEVEASRRVRAVGLRPEALHARGDGASGIRFRARVEEVEMLGHERIVFVRPPAPRIDADSGAEDPEGLVAARLEAGGGVEPGDEIELAADPSDLHFFDADGRRL